jgi:histidinol-phosphatase (PHP family)
MEPILYETHMHTPLCKHARGEPEEYAAVAEQRGLKGIIVTCHNPIKAGWDTRYRMDLNRFDDYLAMVERARQAWAGRVDVRLGMESDFYPGAEPWLTELHQRAEFHYILGSVHSTLPQYRERYFHGDEVAYQRLHFDHLAQAAETGLYDTLAHADLVKIIDPKQWQVERLLEDIRRSLDRIAATGIAMEINTSGKNKPLAQMHPDLPILQEMAARRIPVVIGADAHDPGRVADGYEAAMDLLEAVGYSHLNIFLNRQRHEIKIESARQSLKPVG